ncbi:MAG: MFS transporter [Asticcacaulis sp.]|nr:MFS transporter [Asticcacaulis sp.]
MPHSDDAAPQAKSPPTALTGFVIALIAFFTLVDLFATQAILPLLAHAYAVKPAVMGVAVNASTFGMAIGALLTALFGDGIDRRKGIAFSLVLLTIPTALLATAPNLTIFAALRVTQGLCMATAFTLTLAHLGQACSPRAQAGAFAAYITGNVASNLFGRLIAASAAGMYGLSVNFYIFAALNLLGAALAFATIRAAMPAARQPLTQRLKQFAQVLSPPVLAGFGVGFCILFAFIGVFSYVNFVLMAQPLGLGMMSLGLVYFVFAPSILLTPLAGACAVRFGTRATLWSGLIVAGIGLACLLATQLPLVLAGLVLVGAGTFFAQATATGFVSRAAGANRSAASGLYLASYFAGGLAGAAILGQAYDRLGWPACVAGVALALAAAAILGIRFTLENDPID